MPDKGAGGPDKWRGRGSLCGVVLRRGRMHGCWGWGFYRDGSDGLPARRRVRGRRHAQRRQRRSRRPAFLDFARFHQSGRRCRPTASPRHTPPFKSPVEKRFSKNRALRGRHGAVAMYFRILLCVSKCCERQAKFNVSLLKNHLGHINASSGKLHCCGTLHILVITKIISSHSVGR